MKKLLGIGAIFAGALLLTGCGGSKTYTCSVTLDEDGEKTTQEVIAYLDKDGKVEAFDLVLTTEKEETAEQVYSIYQMVAGDSISKNGKKVTIKDVQNIQGNEMKLVGKTKDEVKEYLVSIEPDATCK